jgi:hypothetical protein
MEKVLQILCVRETSLASDDVFHKFLDNQSAFLPSLSLKRDEKLFWERGGWGKQKVKIIFLARVSLKQFMGQI